MRNVRGYGTIQSDILCYALKGWELSTMEKIYLLDTNVLIYDPGALYSFEGALVGLPAVVLEELDSLKREGTDRGRSAREIIRLLDKERTRGSLKDGVKLDNGSTLKVIFIEVDKLPSFPFKIKIEDNIILLNAVLLKEQGYDVRFISKDLNARIKADALGIIAEDYLKERISVDEFYKWWRTLPVPAVQLTQEMPDELRMLAQDGDLALNEFVLLESQHNPHNAKLFRYKGGSAFTAVKEHKLKWPLRPRNVQQMMAFDLLLDDTIQLITLFGPAGTGKTFLALLAGLHKVLVEDLYEKLLVARPVVPLGRDIGYLPGDLQEKLYSWMLPVYDNMDFIIHAVQTGHHIQDVEHDYQEEQEHEKSRVRSKQKYRKGKKYKRPKGGIMPLEQLVDNGKLSLEAITYMRGRSIPYQFILIDEVQNLTPHEVKTLVTRVGTGSKIILAGDPYQIDSPYLDFGSNGLIVASERFKGQELFGSVYLHTSERSELSKLASQLL